MNNPKVYISGGITGVDEYMTHFSKAESKLIEDGYSVVNPAKVNSMLPQDTDYEEYMKMSMCMLDMCDYICMLKGWKIAEVQIVNMVMRWQRTRRLCLSEVVFMREILFKAKRIDNGAWVEGYVFDDGFADSKRLFVGGLVIMDYKGTADDRWNVGTAFYEVIPDTICQYTGLTDKNGSKIWENDVVKKYNSNGDEWRISKIIWADYSLNMGWCTEDIKSLTEYSGRLFKVGFDVNDAEKCEVIGNIFDNKELLEN